MKARVVTTQGDESLNHGKMPRGCHSRLKGCDTTPIAASLRRAGCHVLERLG